MKLLASFLLFVAVAGQEQLHSSTVLPDGERLRIEVGERSTVTDDWFGKAIAAACCKICRKGKACGDSC